MIKLVSNLSSNYHEDPVFYFNFDKYTQQIEKDCILFYGAHPHESIFQESEHPKYFLSTEEQTWDVDSTNKYVNYVDKIFTICPPKITNRPKREFIFFPVDTEHITPDSEKIYDVIYAGYAEAPHVDEIINVIKNYNYRFISFSKRTGYETNIGVTYKEKLSLISQSKISVIHNLTGTGTPQLKSRPFESALSKSLILCKKDNWNIIEDWFEPNVDFIYYNNSAELNFLINDVLNNYEHYQSKIISAYNKAINNYTSKHFIENYLGK